MVSTILYDKQEADGFGPGANETGVIVYELPEKIATDIQKIGIDYLNKLPSTQEDRQIGKLKWKSTPIWDWDGLSEYLTYYGHRVDIDSRLETEIDRAMSTPGNYFAKKRIGVLIVIPKTSRVVFAYRG
jgi:hypothetical protein